jgi:palmitoyltransferase ZDHHC9/14/18
LTWTLTLVLVSLQVFTSLCFFLTAWSNPGIIPRSSLRGRTQMSLEATRGKQAGSKVHQLIVSTNGAHLTRLKYCHTCLVLRPERAFHCHFCGNCVHQFDHHCIWLGSCIAGRNYKQFFSFLIGVMCLQWTCILYNVAHLVVSTIDTYEI